MPGLVSAAEGVLAGTAPEVTVLVPVYNVQKYLPMTLAGLQAQDFGGWVCHILDDGSTDGTLAVAEGFAARDGRFVVEHQANSGVSAAWNRLLEGVRTPFVLMLDSDDLLHPHLLGYALALAKEHGADMVEFDNDRVPEAFSQADIPPFPEAPAVTVLRDLSCFQTRSCAPGTWINKCNKLYRSAAIAGLRFDPGLTYEEDFWFNVLAHARSRCKVVVDHCLYYYRTTPRSLTQRINYPRYVASGIRRIALSHQFFIEEGRLLPAYREAYACDITRDAFRMILQKNLKRNPCLRESRALFAQAAEALAEFLRRGAIFPERLQTRRQRWALALCIRRHYWLCRAMIYLSAI